MVVIVYFQNFVHVYYAQCKLIEKFFDVQLQAHNLWINFNKNTIVVN